MLNLDPIFVGELKLPVESDNWAVKVLLENIRVSNVKRTLMLPLRQAILSVLPRVITGITGGKTYPKVIGPKEDNVSSELMKASARFQVKEETPLLY